MIIKKKYTYTKHNSNIKIRLVTNIVRHPLYILILYVFLLLIKRLFSLIASFVMYLIGIGTLQTTRSLLSENSFEKLVFLKENSNYQI